MTDLAQQLIDAERKGWQALASGSGGQHYRTHLAPNRVSAQRSGEEPYEAIVSSTFVRGDGPVVVGVPSAVACLTPDRDGGVRLTATAV